MIKITLTLLIISAAILVGLLLWANTEPGEKALYFNTRTAIVVCGTAFIVWIITIAMCVITGIARVWSM